MSFNSTYQSIVNQTRDLVRIPTQEGVNSLGPIFLFLGDWLTRNKLKWEILSNIQGRKVALLVTVSLDRPGPIVCLNAPIDTAPVGEKGNWQFPPFSAETASGKMYGRGVADSKVAAAIFCHVAKRIHEEGSIRGSLHVLLDGYEHTGEFGGAKAYIELKHMKPSFVAVGYPGNENILIGARGFFRACVRTFGKEQHSGSRSNVPSDNPILKMATLIQWLSKEHLPDEIDQEFSFGPKVSVTSVSGGRTFSQIPDLCEARIDIRLTPNFGPHQAHSLLENVISKIDAEFPGKRTTYERVRTWPCFKLSRDSKAVTIFKNSAESIFGKTINLNVSGPSNIGNYLAEKHIPATCGFGVSYENLHTANESIRLDTILPVYETYLNCVPAWAENLEFERPDARQPNCIFEALNPTT